MQYEHAEVELVAQDIDFEEVAAEYSSCEGLSEAVRAAIEEALREGFVVPSTDAHTDERPTAIPPAGPESQEYIKLVMSTAYDNDDPPKTMRSYAA